MADTATRNFKSSKSAADLFAIASDPNAYASIEGCDSVEVNSSDDSQVEATATIKGQQIKVRFELNSPSEIKMEITDGPAPNWSFIDYFRGSWAFADADGGCDVTLTLDFNIKIPMGAKQLKDGAENLAEQLAGFLQAA